MKLIINYTYRLQVRVFNIRYPLLYTARASRSRSWLVRLHYGASVDTRWRPSTRREKPRFSIMSIGGAVGTSWIKKIIITKIKAWQYFRWLHLTLMIQIYAKYTCIDAVHIKCKFNYKPDLENVIVNENVCTIFTNVFFFCFLYTYEIMMKTENIIFLFVKKKKSYNTSEYVHSSPPPPLSAQNFWINKIN